MYMYYNVSPPCMTAYILKFHSPYNLRGSHKLEIPLFKSNIKKFSISHRGPILWNLQRIDC